jgi:3-dehydroquinate dehydratase-2
MKILILNGPNLNLLGLREPDIYGRKTYADLKAYIAAVCRDEDIGFEIRQSNHEGDLVDMIQEAYGIFDAIVINPAAYTHTSIAILDALKAVSIPAVEVHLSDISEREQFRHVSYAGLACIKTFKGLGFEGYKEALLFLKEYLNQGSRE